MYNSSNKNSYQHFKGRKIYVCFFFLVHNFALVSPSNFLDAEHTK